VRWGVLGAAGIAVRKVIPGMRGCRDAVVAAIASRSHERARAAADALGVERAYGSYDELLADPFIDVVYVALPNHLHVPWSVRALEAGKHVLCEKPIGLSVADALPLLAARTRTGRLVGEAFMVRVHPQWRHVRRLVDDGAIGDLRLVTGHFSYSKTDAGNIRNRLDYGGGALLDIGCYPVMLSRWLFGAEPRRVCALVERDPEYGVDRLVTGMLDFAAGQASFTCGTQVGPAQRMHVFGTAGHIEVEIPFNAPPTEPCRLVTDDGGGARTIEVPAADQYALQADAFSAAVRGTSAVPVPLEDAIGNMAVLDALFLSAERGGWVVPAPAAESRHA
jgi:predicted dehydrogenase